MGEAGKTDVRWTDRLIAGVILALCLGLVAIPASALAPSPAVVDATTTQHGLNEAWDEARYHLPVIQTFAEQWPSVDLVDYRSATSPGYHLLQAGVWNASGGRIGALRAVNLLIGMCLVGAIGWFAAGHAGAGRAVAFGLPFVCCSYVLGGAAWLTTDNAALLFVALALGVSAMRVGRLASPGGAVGAGVLGALAVGVRQIHVWVAAPIGLSAAIASGAFLWLARRKGARVRWPLFAAGVIGAALPFAMLAWLVWMWGGLMPPTYRDLHASGVSWSIPALTLSFVGLFGVWFWPAVWGEVRRMRIRDGAAWAVAGAGLLAAVAVETAFSREDGRRFGWLWEIVRRMPSAMERTPVFVVLAPIGALTLLLLWRGAHRRGNGAHATVLLAALLAWTSAQMANAQAWQRYVEPIALLWVCWLAALAWDGSKSRLVWLAPLALAGLELLVTLVMVYRPLLMWQ